MEAKLLIGLPGSGKSTWAKNQKEFIVNRDTLRTMVYGKYDFRIENEPAILDMSVACVAALAQDSKPIIIDETSGNINTRIAYVTRLKFFGYRIKYVWFQTPIDICIKRRNEDPKGLSSDWEAIIRKLSVSFRAPTPEEGYDELIVV